MQARGFTLIELAVVIMIVAITAAAVTLRLEGPLRRAGMRDVVEAVASFDRLSRAYAREHDRSVRVVVDTVRGQLVRTDASSGGVVGAPVKLPPEYRIAKVWVRGRAAADTQTTIPCSRLGLMPTYALLLHGPGRRRQALLFAGLSGELLRLDDETELEAIGQAMSSRRDPR